jgi:hypothetical protein
MEVRRAHGRLKLNKHRKVELSWHRTKPESFGVRYVLETGKTIECNVTRSQDESVDNHLKRIGRVCICAAKGVLATEK